MRILHVWDCAGDSGCMAEYQRKLGHEAVVIMLDGYDGFKQKTFYNVQIVGPRARGFAHFGPLRKPLKILHYFYQKLWFHLYVAWVARLYDVVHIHSVYAVSLLMPFKPKIIQFHGDEIRKTPNLHGRLWKGTLRAFLWLNRNKTFYVATPDLMCELRHACYLPIPVDTNHFSRVLPCIPNTALYLHNWHEKNGYERAVSLAKKYGLRLKIIDRTIMGSAINYASMPRLLERYEYFISRATIKSLSKTALEMLALGGKVIDHNDEVITAFPSECSPWSVAEQTIKIYKEAMK